MKLATFERGGVQRIGAVTEDLSNIVDLAAGWQTLSGVAHPALSSMLALMEAGEAGLETARNVVAETPATAVLPLAAVRLLSPVPVPQQMRDFSVFEKHSLQCAATVARLGLVPGAPPTPAPIAKVWYEQPLYYKCNRFSVIGTDTEVAWPPYANILDYELELGIFIGKTGRDISRADAKAHIFGYTIYNDFSARDAQIRETAGARLGPAKGKDFDTGNAIGPWIVTADELDNPYDLTMRVRVNGKLRGEGHSGGMQHDFEAMIAHVSQSETLHAGEFFGSGTVGNGCGLEFGVFLEDGDLVELEIERIGVLRNRVRKQAR